MARLFNGTSDGLTGGAPTSSSDLTMAGWFWINATNVAYVLCSLGTLSSGNNRRDLVHQSTAVFQARSVNNAGTTVLSSKSSTGLSGQWVFIGGVWTGTTRRQVFVNATNGTADLSSNTPNTPSEFRVGVSHTGTSFLAGRAAGLAVWNAAFTTEEMALLSKGFSPLLFRSGNIVAYWPMIGRTSTENTLVGGITLSGITTMPSVIEHPRVMFARSKAMRTLGASAAQRSFLLVRF